MKTDEYASLIDTRKDELIRRYSLIMQMPKEHILDFFKAVLVLQDNQVQYDNTGNNLLYDKENGFSLIDLEDLSLEKKFEEQNLSKRAKLILAILFRDYWATDIQRKKIMNKQNKDRLELEEAKRQKYNSNVFTNKEPQTIVSENSVAMVEYKESIFTKIKNWFKLTF